MKKLPLVSVALAAFNGERYIEEQILSIVHQTWKNIEIVVSDDHSTDTTVSIVQKLKKKYPHIKLFTNTLGKGFIKNFENAISHCSGKYIALSDQDDIWLEDKIEQLVAHINGYDIIASDMMVIDENGSMISQSLIHYQGFVIPNEEDVYKTLVFRNCYTGATMLMEAKFAKKCLPIPQEAQYHDWWFAINAAANNGILLLEKPLVKYRQHGKNVVGAKQKDEEKNKITSQKVLHVFTKTRREQLKEEFFTHYKRIKCYIVHGIYRNKDDYAFLTDIADYYKSYISYTTRIITVYKGFQLRKYLYPGDNIIKVLFRLLAKLF